MSEASDHNQRIADGLVFTVNYRHTTACGTPPAIDGNVGGRYHGYFENAYGEQAVFVYEYETEEGILFLGNLNWEEPIRVVDGRAPGVILTDEEAVWLLARWKTTTAFHRTRRDPAR